MSSNDRPIRGSIYHDAPARYAAPTPWARRDSALVRLAADQQQVFDGHAEQALDALVQVLEWHRPWMHWEQVFDPIYIGDRFEGQGCRSCNWLSPNECPTATIICDTLGIPA